MATPFSLIKVNAIPPPMIMMFTLSSKFMMSWILSDTLAPPKMPQTGLLGLSKTLAKASNSLASRKPETFTG